jgi:Uma2 family endonuclease
MATLVCDATIEERLLAERAASGADRYDEVWEGVYVMAPMPNDEHQQIVNRLAAIFQEVIDWPGLGHVRPGVNISDRKEDWTQNYRVPDVAVFLETGSAENCDAFWFGGPDFAVEIVSPGDQSREKMEFYGRVGARELLLIDREPWELHLMRLQGERLVTADRVVVDGPPVTSEVLPFQFSLRAGIKRPTIHVVHASGKSWDV